VEARTSVVLQVMTVLLLAVVAIELALLVSATNATNATGDGIRADVQALGNQLDGLCAITKGNGYSFLQRGLYCTR
jgi:hypothetical protein